MASGYQVHGTDLDYIFAPRGTSTPRADVGYQTYGTDLAQRFHASTGSDQISTDTGYQSHGTDLRYLFRGISFVGPTITGGGFLSAGSFAYVGDSIFWNITATGSPTLTYQWYKNGTPISGATGSSYTWTVTSTGDSGAYTVVVSNSISTATVGLTLTCYAVPTASLTGSTSVAVGGGGGGSWSFSGTAGAGLLQVRFQVTSHGSGAWGGASGTTYSGGPVNWTSPFGSPDFASTPGTYDFYFEVEDVHGRTARADLSVTVS